MASEGESTQNPTAWVVTLTLKPSLGPQENEATKEATTAASEKVLVLEPTRLLRKGRPSPMVVQKNSIFLFPRDARASPRAPFDYRHW